MPATENFAGSLIEMLLKDSNYVPDYPLYVALYFADPTAWFNEIYLSASEISASRGYKRMSASSTKLTQMTYASELGAGNLDDLRNLLLGDNWDVEDGIAYNKLQIIFPGATSDWEWVTYIGLVSSSVIGEEKIYFYGKLSASQLVTTGASLVIPAGGINIDFNPSNPSTYLTENLTDLLFNNSATINPELSVFLALYNELPWASGSGGREVSGSVGYHRIRLAGDDWSEQSWKTTPWVYNSGCITLIEDIDVEWGYIDGAALLYTTGSNSGDPGDFLFLDNFDVSSGGAPYISYACVNCILGDSLYVDWHNFRARLD